MNCATHPELAAVAYCRSCGKALCADCRRPAHGTIYCEEHAPVESASAPPSAGAVTRGPAGANPAIAFILGWIPGVGAIYNGQYAKGMVHAIVFGLFVSILSTGSAEGLEPLVGILLGAFVLYMPFEAYHTASRRNRGEELDEFSSVVSLRHRRSTTGAITLIIVGAVFLLDTLGVLPMHRILRFWPILLIVLGIAMLHSRLTEAAGQGEPRPNNNREVNQ